jgi:hypothetical protein
VTTARKALTNNPLEARHGRPGLGGETWGPTLTARVAAGVISLLLIVLLYGVTFRSVPGACLFTHTAQCEGRPPGSGTPVDTATIRLEPGKEQGR